MAKRPAKSSGSRLTNIMGLLRGNVDVSSQDDKNTTLPLGSAELISAQEKSKILSKVIDGTDDRQPGGGGNQAMNILSMVQTSLSKVGSDRMENRKILQLMPEVDKAARLMIASTFAPNDLSSKDIPITFDVDFLNDSVRQRLNEKVTDFFQKKLNLRKSAPQWVYQFGYETGSSVFSIIPLRSFESIQEDSYLGIESFTKQVIDPIGEESLFGFGYSGKIEASVKSDAVGLENFAHEIIASGVADNKTKPPMPSLTKDLIEKMIGQEALKLTDNPSILQVKDLAKEKVQNRTSKTLKTKFKRPHEETIVSVPTKPDTQAPLADPILFRLPPESVTVIHTPGDPNDHLGYFVLLDNFGNPINSTTMEEANFNRATQSKNNQNDIFSQVYNAYGMSSGFKGYNQYDSMNLIYSKIVSEHLKNRVGKAGYTNVALGNTDSMMRCMFTRFMAQKKTRVLFLPKDLVTYMSFELDQNGYGVSRLDRIKFNLGMKMAVQVSRVLAAIKAAMDKRNVSVRFTDNLMEPPESIFNSIMTEYMRKSTMSFSVDPNIIQNQIIDKSLSIKGINMPGMEEFELSNEPDSRSGSVDFDPTMTEYLDQQILHGLRVPPATMNSVGQDEYARSVSTTNLFFAMDVSLDQDIVVHHISDLLQKYARFSQSFYDIIYDIIPSLKSKEKNSSIDSNKEESDETKKDEVYIPNGFTIDKLIDSMTISLPRPNVAPSKAQFEALTAMIEAIGQTVDSLFPEELIGSDDTLAPAVRLLKAKFKTSNIREYLENSGMSGLDVPESDFTGVMPSVIAIQDALANITALLKDKATINTPTEPTDPSLDEYK